MNIVQIFEQFPTQQTCIEHLERARWNGTPRCPYCGSDRTARLQHRHRCYACKTSFSVTVRTIFHHTHMPLQKWFLAVMLILNAKKGISALQLSRDLKVNKNTAWRIAMQIRKAMTQTEQRHLLTGIVEMDETYIGGKPRKGGLPSKPGRGTKKIPVIGAVERGGRVAAKVTRKEKLKGRNLRAFVRDQVQTDEAHLITDELQGLHRNVEGASSLRHPTLSLVRRRRYSHEHNRGVLGSLEAWDVRPVSQRQPQAPTTIRR